MATVTPPISTVPVAEAAAPVVVPATDPPDLPLASSPTGAATAAVAAKSSKHTARKRAGAAETAREVRKLYWPTVHDDKLWLLNGERGGFAQVPRTLSLFSEVVIKRAVKKKTGVSSSAGTTYTVLWLRTQGQGLAKIDSETDAALEAGYGGERGITTFRKHMRVLKDLRFVDFVEESRGRVKWVLMLNPYVVLKDLLAADLVDKRTYAAVLERVSAIGSSDELKGGDDVAE